MTDLFASASRKTLRPYQAEAISQVRKSLANGNRRVVLALPTGGGKTLVASHIVAGALSKGGRAVFTAPMVTLVDQTIEAFEAEGVSQIGAMQADHPRTNASAPVQVASVQTLVRRCSSEFPDASVVLVDECHVRSKAITDWMRAEPSLVFIGLSATPGRAGMADEWDDLVVGTTTQDLVDQGFLSQHTVYAPNRPDLTGVKIVAGEFASNGAQEVMEDGKLIGDICQNYILNGEDRPTLGFGVSVAHAKRMAEEFCNAGIPSAYVEARTDTLERRALQDQFRRGQIKVIWSVRTMTTGVDLPVSGIIDAAPTRSEMLHQQKIGRGLRVNPGTEDLKVWDHAGNTLRLGFVTDLDWSMLRGGTAKVATSERSDPLPKECAQCAGVMEPKAKECPFCGHEAKPPSGWIETEDGELVPINREVKSKEVSQADKERFYRELLGYCVENNQKPGAAYYRFKEKFGSFPANTYSRVPLPPSRQTRSWVKSRQIAYAKAKAKVVAHV